MPTETTVDALLDRYQGMLLDAYGVLVDGTGALPGAADLVRRLEKEARPWCVVTNDASRSPAACGARYRALGVPVPDHRVLTSGLLLEPFFAHHRGARSLVLGPPDTRAYVRAAGGVDVGPEDDALETASVIVLGDAGGYDFLPAMDAVLSAVMARVDAQLPLAVVVPNPDLIFPKAPSADGRPPAFGFAAGTMAAMIEGALALRPPTDTLSIHRLGKPGPRLFQRAMDQLGTSDLVMLGDQLATDIAGAHAAGLDAALVVSGVSGHAPASGPMWWLPSLFSQ